MPSYDEGATLKGYLESLSVAQDLHNVWASCLWAGIPFVPPGEKYLATEATVSLRVDKPYKKYETDSLVNNGLPMYTWDMSKLQTYRNVNSIAVDALEMIRVVPNPYYAFSEHYEQNQLDNFVKITNLPERCTVSIYDVSAH